MSTNSTDLNSSLGNFQYAPLARDTNEIRLIRIIDVRELSEASTNQVLELEMFHTTFTDAAAYLAMSYAWGDPTPTKRVVCNNAYLLTPESTFRTLFTIYHHARQYSTPFYRAGDRLNLWIDALCINQSDTDEKNFQVRLMDKVYGQAKGVIGYVGEPGSGGDPRAGFHAMCSLGNAAIVSPSPEGIPTDQTDPRFQEWYRSIQTPRPVENSFATDLASFWANEWFIRCWVTQETQLPGESIR
jgi:hypothetical protein